MHTAYAQSDPEVTGAGAANVARAAARVRARLVLVSSDVVFGGSKHEQLFRSLAHGGDGVLFEDERRCPVHVADLTAWTLLSFVRAGARTSPTPAPSTYASTRHWPRGCSRRGCAGRGSSWRR